MTTRTIHCLKELTEAEVDEAYAAEFAHLITLPDRSQRVTFNVPSMIGRTKAEVNSVADFMLEVCAEIEGVRDTQQYQL